MEHEVFVPFPVESVRRVLADPARVVRCVPGLQQDVADASGALVAGRLRLRIGGSTITYRGSLHLTERDGGYDLSGEGGEVRGSGTVTLTLRGLLEPVEGGTRLVCVATVGSGGRLAEFDEKTTEATARRLLDRFAAALAEELREDAEEEAGDGPRLEGGSVFDTEVPPPSLDPAEDALDEDAESDDDGADDEDDEDDEDDDEAPAAEAAHARRTMIGRSAEEVDHAPPRGRYAPVPAPEAASATAAALRWAAPAAAVALASAVVVGRVLRRRR
ncbi:SRPBCC domain-containing protein [Streptomyces albireticuli]|uniref:Carbon monoxide dehydrogenase subunit G n=1 Tax=Streptomyces albireticuli TaxID=1940 RepID=A0A2A2CZ28_9ACTN|nr:SRPBCC domain-containing protein [Streptomyces albireticuli]MCD9143938.1 carbon monoxide dehydrogenase subunit G [Streptomyces albireticuli]MCD9161631.1 carbon monoxide dehydrogenase subunit G [Streptomyces albireticuli]MCD9192055.1 carbon monoxide dehydrogenase subunit G [Streptomyces albireticuli]PAU44467.1 carbon monoxide dehydrogenase subunit G [Streptomyces albireticuli]